MTNTEIIELAMDDRREFEEAKRAENQKLFPFYVFTNFRVNSVQGIKNPILRCDYCGRNLSKSGNGSYFTSFVVFEDPATIRALCSLRCKHIPDNLMEFGDQKYGFREPVTLPELYSESVKYKLVYRACLKSTANMDFWARQYPNGIDMELFKERVQPIYQGASFGEGSYDFDRKGIVYYKNVKNGKMKEILFSETTLGTYEYMEDYNRVNIFKLKPGEVLHILNNIIKKFHEINIHK